MRETDAGMKGRRGAAVAVIADALEGDEESERHSGGALSREPNDGPASR